MFEAGLAQLLTGDAGVSALAADRVYPVALPLTPTLPAVNYAITSRTADPTVDGNAEFIKRVRFGCWGNEYLDARELCEALHALLDNFDGALPDGTIVLQTTPDTESDLFEPDARQFCVVVDFVFRYSA